MGVINNYFQLLINHFSDRSYELQLPKIIIDTLDTEKEIIILAAENACHFLCSYHFMKVECNMKHM